MYPMRQSRGQSHLVRLPLVRSNLFLCFSFAHVRTPRWEGGDGPRDSVRGKSVLTGPDTMLDGWTARFSPANRHKYYHRLALGSGEMRCHLRIPRMASFCAVHDRTVDSVLALGRHAMAVTACHHSPRFCIPPVTSLR